MSATSKARIFHCEEQAGDSVQGNYLNLERNFKQKNKEKEKDCSICFGFVGYNIYIYYYGAA